MQILLAPFSTILKKIVVIVLVVEMSDWRRFIRFQLYRSAGPQSQCIDTACIGNTDKEV